MADSASNFCLPDKLNPNYDITWSFQYAVMGINNPSGAFSTFLFDNETLSGGGKYEGAGVKPYLSENGVHGFVLGIVFLDSGYVQVYSRSNEVMLSSPVGIFSLMNTFVISELEPPLVKTEEKFYTVRFNLTNSAQLLNIAVKNSENRYVTTQSIPTGLLCKETDFYRIGFGYSSPLKSGFDKINLKLKNISVQGNTDEPSVHFNNRPDILLPENNKFLVQSPSGEKIDIHFENPSLDGSLLNK